VYGQRGPSAKPLQKKLKKPLPMKIIHLALLMPLLFAACKKESSPVAPAVITPPVVTVPDTCTRLEWKSGIGGNFTNPCGFAVSPTGQVAVSAYNGGYGTLGKVIIYKSIGGFLHNESVAVFYTYNNAKAPEALVFDKDGNLYIAETEGTAGITVLKRGATSYSKVKTIQGGFSNPRGMAFDDQGRLYLCDDGNNRIVRFNAPLTSNTSTTVITGLGAPKGIAYVENRLYVAEYSGNRLSEWQVDSFASPTAVTPVMAPVDVTANTCFAAVSQPGSKVVSLFHRRLLTASAGSYPVGNQCFGMWLHPTKAALVMALYERNKVVEYTTP
jgi:hypothetical protein